MNTLIIVESPHKASTIQTFLPKTYKVVASKGHITELSKGGKHGLGVDIENDFKPHYSLLPDKVSTLDMLIGEASKADEIILAGDPDREGSAICWHIADRLSQLNKPMRRAKFKEIKKSVVLKAIKDATDLNLNEVNAQKTRQILDRIVGFTASPFLMNAFGGKLSSGRVQSVVTKMVIEREDEIKSFVPENYWVITGAFTDNLNPAFSAKLDKKISSQADADKTYSSVLSVKDFFVSAVSMDDEKRAAPPPLVTSTLQRTMSKNHGLAPDETMKAAQTLYEGGHITYLRTDSVRASDEAISEVRDYIVNTHELSIPKKPLVYKNGDAAQDGHECLRPTNIEMQSNPSFSPEEAKVYEVIWKYFVCSQMPPAIYSTLKLTIESSTDPSIKFKASGKTLKEPGFYQLMGVSDSQRIEMPFLKQGDKLFPSGTKFASMDKKTTQPPARYSYDNLIKEMESKKIGRPATYADLLIKLSARDYVEMKGKIFYATPLGKKVTDSLNESFSFMDYGFTADMEKKLDLVEAGTLSPLDMLKSFYPNYKKELNSAYEKIGAVFCEKCGSPMAIRTSKAGSEFLACSGYPKCKNSRNI
jgi:DNA topoisomerase I